MFKQLNFMYIIFLIFYCLFQGAERKTRDEERRKSAKAKETCLAQGGKYWNDLPITL